ncbi:MULTISPECIES: DUF3857 domain-containing protein [Aequorivita]|uniref:DUF3857 domain-containing protein n=1 Tax=Aequorivita iocasae TaxID=2803865 RepID=A0ABX7DPC6_9FLAO|nr:MULTISPECIES: DUF3857 domain-containing protein [Aequorivita]QQX75368.1 DUF3857 domain-containing protein [Aequorivita iocasae]UCA54817.1 DUF3857 domain-containing protein [Aequorivita sp. F7]
MKKIFCLAILFCSAHIFSQTNYSIASISKELTEYSNSVLIDELVEIDVTNYNKLEQKNHRVVAVLNKLGDGDTRLYEFYDENSRVKDIEVRIYNASGKQIEHFKKKDFMDVSRTGISIYSDDRMLGVNYTPTTYPYIVVFDSETETGDTAFLSSWVPLNGYAESTQKSVMKIKYDPANKPKYKPQNLEGFDISISETPEELIFSATNLAAIRYEEHSVSMSKIFPVVYVSLNNFKLKGTAGSGKDWQQFGSWMNKSLLSDVSDLPEGTVARVKSLVANETTNEGKARKIYQFVQDKVRYVSINIGIGGWKPMLASEVDKLSYGDCKALTNYTKVLLDAVGVPSYYTIVYGDETEWDIMEDFSSIQGNHIILGIPNNDEITWLECTSQDTPYGYIGNFTDDRDVLILTPEGGKIAHTKIYETEENTRENISKVKVDAAGNVVANFKSVSKGLQYDGKYLLPKQKQEDIDQYYKKKWSYINGFSIADVQFNNDRETVVFEEELALNIPNYANPVGNDYLFCANIFNQNQHIPPRIENRKQNLYIDNGYIHTDSVEIEIPENFEVDGLPEETILETKFGTYQMGFSNADDKLIYTRRILIKKGEYPPSEYENYRDFLRNIARLDKTKILLKQNVQ